MEDNHHYFIALSNPVEGHEDEYNEWYDAKHIPECLQGKYANRHPGRTRHTFPGCRRQLMQREWKMRRHAVAALMLLVLGACAPISYVVLLENEDGSTGKVIVEGKQGTTTVSRAGHGAALDGSSEKSFEVENEAIAKVFGAAMAAQPQPPVSFMLYFLSDSAELKTGSRAELDKAVAAMRARKAPDVSVILFTDNDRLALRRATVIADQIRKTDIDITDLTITSHGENYPVVVTADGVNESRNRRVQITVR